MRMSTGLAACAVFAAGLVAGRLSNGVAVHAQSSTRVFELRTYTAPEGRLGDLESRFRNHTAKLFEKHGITNIGYWVPQDAPLHSTTLTYLIAYPNRDEAKKRWAAFQADPEWRKVFTESEANGRLTTKIESMFLDPADFSPIH